MAEKGKVIMIGQLPKLTPQKPYKGKGKTSNRSCGAEKRMENLALNSETIDHVKTEATEMVKKLIGADLIEVILYGSCARGDYTEDSDIDIALLMKCDRREAKKYDDVLAKISTELAMKYFAIVNFVSLPYSEFVEKNVVWVFFKKAGIIKCIDLTAAYDTAR